nr:MAG TPA: hypothetical protein [Caudoviricetes sp.]
MSDINMRKSSTDKLTIKKPLYLMVNLSSMEKQKI